MINPPIKLSALEPEFQRWISPAEYETTAALHDADGLEFDDPLGGGFRILIWFKQRPVPLSAEPGPARWLATGSGVGDLTLHPSVDLTCAGQFPERWHGWIREGFVL